jgi:hypothetical protein
MQISQGLQSPNIAEADLAVFPQRGVDPKILPSPAAAIKQLPYDA